MNGDIANLICSTDEEDVHCKNSVFQRNFQAIGGWLNFLNNNLAGGSVATQLRAAGPTWNPASFQGLYVACWIYHPVEKGTFMIDLSSLTIPQHTHVEHAVNALPNRKSSHLSGKGHTASAGWNFLIGYEELLVQWELTQRVPFLFLKAEGHALTSVSGAIPHLASWVKKEITGSGAQASAGLHQLATSRPNLVEARAAENFGKAYEKLVEKKLKMGKRATIRDVLDALHVRFNDPAPPNLRTMDGRGLGRYLLAFIISHYAQLSKINSKLPGELHTVASSLMSDEAGIVDRVYREIRVTPDRLDASLQNFRTIANAAEDEA
jgi:hypothetical protein